MESDVVVVPWVHWVCTQCLQDNPYAVWLIKLKCLNPTNHQFPHKKTLVSIEPCTMMLVKMRPPPPVLHPARGRGRYRHIHVCQSYPNCQLGDLCPFPHSEVEYHTWSFIKTVFKDKYLKDMVCSAKLVPQSPTRVCVKCYDEASEDYNTWWLPWLECAQPKDHKNEDRITVIVGDDFEIVEVIGLPSSCLSLQPSQLSLCRKVSQRQGCRDEVSCNSAHTPEELNYWKWSIIHENLGKVSKYHTFCKRYSYTPDETSLSIVGLQRPLSPRNYISKFHKLVYLDEIAHCLKMATLCNHNATVTLCTSFDRQQNKSVLFLMLSGMEGAAMDYAIHGHAVAHVPVIGTVIQCVVSHREEESLLLHLPQGRQPPSLPKTHNKVYVHFEINHKYFNDLHKAIDSLSKVAVQKLLPSKSLLPQCKTGKPLSSAETLAIKPYTLDSEYQMNALERMTSSDPRVPFVVLGPFGTGKTHILAAAVAALLCNRQNHILVCTHQNQCANSIYESLQKFSPQYSNVIMRLVPNQQAASYIHGEGVVLMKYLDISSLNEKRIIITTFLTAKNLKSFETSSQTLKFSHILIDEGAQTREPEAIGALAVAKPETKIVIVGDNKQVGPKVVVLSDLAQQYELGDSLLERLLDHYKNTSNKCVKNHTASLLTNYRCHSSILTLTSSLFYEHTLLSRSSSETHPLAPYPLVFTCSSIDNQSLKNLPADNQHEAKVLVEKMLTFVDKWPRTKSKPVGLLASTRKQVNAIRQQLKQIPTKKLPFKVEAKPTYLIQGDEFSAVFLSTVEPTDEEGKPHDPVRSISNELVFNTIMTRSRSLIVCIGNPFVLCKLGELYKTNCWSAYLQRCVQCETLQFALPANSTVDKVEAAAQIQKKVFPHTVIDQTTAIPLTNDVDNIIDQYIRTLKERKEYRIGCTLVRNPKGNVDWKGNEEVPEDNVILCRLDFKFFHEAKAVPLDPSEPTTMIKGKQKLKGSLPGDVVRIDTIRKCVLFDEKTEEAISKTHFGSSFLCRVSDFNCIQFYPLDKCYPKFVNLPTITREEKKGVVCFDPSSINSTPRVSNVIPHEVALRMVFVVKFLGWKKKYGYPLGIIVGALPSNSIQVQQLLLKLQHNIPLSIVEHPIATKQCQASTIQGSKQKAFSHAITIDPEGSTDHDDALTCTYTQQGKKRVYSVGVHITNVDTLVGKGSPADKQAAERGCTVYDAPDSISSHMLPLEVLKQASITADKTVKAFTVLTEFTLANDSSETESISLGKVSITESTVTSHAELTYAEAQALLVQDDSSYPQCLVQKMRRYNVHSTALSLKQTIQRLWKFAWFLRVKRLGKAALAYTVREETELLYLEAHYLVEEFMIWANTQVAEKLRSHFKNQTILRSQEPPNKKELDVVNKVHKSILPLSATYGHQSQEHGQSSTCTSVSPLLILKSQHLMLCEDLKEKNARDVMRCVQIEHFHPQLAALYSIMRSLQSSGQYCVLQSDDKEGGSHYSLQCQYYTHFTSPLRRYVDIVVQRQLHACIHKKSNMYTVEELKTVCTTTQKKQKNAQKYERDILSSKFVNTLKQSQREYKCIVSEVNPKQGTISLCFTDMEIRLSQRDSEISTQQLGKNHSTYSVRHKSEIPYEWKVKICSVNGTPASFLNPKEVEVSSTNEESGHLTIYSPDDRDCLTRKAVNIKVKSEVRSIPPQTWLMLQDCTRKGEASIQANSDAILRNIAEGGQTCTPIPHKTWRSALCVYKLRKVLKPFHVMRMQLCAKQGKHVQEPGIQLLEVGPGLRICVHHNKDAVKCFVGKLTRDASKDHYDSLTDYVNHWEPVLLTEAACASVKDAEFLLIRDVQLVWPAFQLCTSSSGYSYYKLTASDNPDKQGVVFKLPEDFMRSSFRFFDISKGDLVCIRFSSNDGTTRYVFHMVVNHVETKEKGNRITGAEVYMKFVLDDSNYISQQVHTAIQERNGSYEIQLIPISTPHRRVYQTLKKFLAATDLAKDIALGDITKHSAHFQGMKDILSPDEISIANSYWSDRKVDSRKLNRYQKDAIKLAWGCKFSMIQGPPGTGKSVTGAHIAYALAMKLCKETPPRQPENMCVMYCGPSQQSVNVILDIFIELLNSSGHKTRNVRLIRVFSKAVEKKQFEGPELNTDLFPAFSSDTKCERRHEIYSLHHIIRQNNPKIKQMEERFKMLDSQGKIASYEDFNDYKQLVSIEEEKVLKSGVNIVLCTCNEAASHRITNSLEPKYCIIDECAMATEPECMVPISRAQHVVLIGDHQQLQPVIQSKDAEEVGLGKSLFQRYAEREREVQIHLLEVQYRMHQAICKFPSKEFYDGRLKTDICVKRRGDVLKLGRFWPQGESCPMVFCQVVGEEDDGHIGLKGRAKVDSQSKFNKREAEKIVKIVEVLVCQYKVPSREIAVLTPYSAQKEAIKDKLSQRRDLEKKNIVVKTITESQGSEYGIVLLSTVRSRPMSQDIGDTADISWIRKNLGFVTDRHRICVGITRSKYGLVIVGNERLLRYDPTWKKLIQHYKKEGCFVQGEKFPL